MRSTRTIHVISARTEGVVGDVIVGGALQPPEARAARIIMESEDTPAMSGANSIQVATVQLDAGPVTTLESLDDSVIEAGYDLGGTGFSLLREIVIPHAAPGIVSGCIVVFMLSLGNYLTPTIPQPRAIRVAYGLYVALFFLYLALPLTVVAVFAFNDSQFPSLPWEGFTWNWFFGQERPQIGV
ncbi:proline racemase family protein, partial [Seohaeicola saemankumensis]